MPESDSDIGSSGPAGGAGSEERAQRAAERSQLYGFLAGVFRREPTPEQLREIADPAFRRLLAEAGVVLDADWLDRPLEDLAGDLAVEFTRLFIGPGPHVSPHESVQRRDGKGRLWGEVTAEVAAFIKDSGLTFDPAYKGLPDHVSVELEFAGALAWAESAAWAEGNQATAAACRDLTRYFLDAHLGRWIGDFSRRVAEQADGPYYRQFADLAARFVNSEMAALAATESDPDRAG